jgi:hypothetical protein
MSLTCSSLQRCTESQFNTFSPEAAKRAFSAPRFLHPSAQVRWKRVLRRRLLGQMCSPHTSLPLMVFKFAKLLKTKAYVIPMAGAERDCIHTWTYFIYYETM